jgi:hypothetical protein
MAIVTYCSPAALESIVEKGFQVDVDSRADGTPESVVRAGLSFGPPRRPIVVRLACRCPLPRFLS